MSGTRRFEQFLSVEKAGGARWHPDGKRLVFTSDATGTFQVYETAVEPGRVMPRTQLTSETDRCTSPRFLSDGSVAFVRDRGGDENFQIGLIDQSRNLHWVTSTPKAKHNVQLTTKEHLYFCANLEDAARLDLHRWKVPLLDNEAELLFQPQAGLVSAEAVSPAGNGVLLSQYLSNVDQHLLLLDIDSGTVTNLTRKLTGLRKTRWRSARWLDDNHMLVLTDHESDRVRPAILSISGDFSPIPELEEVLSFEVEELAYTEDSKWTYFVENQDGYSTIHRGEIGPCGAGELETLPFPIRGVIPTGDQRSWTVGIQLSPDEHHLAVTLSSGIQPTSVWVVGIKDMTSWRVVDVSTAGLDPKLFIEPTLHSFISFDGTRVPYFRYIPHGQRPLSGWPALFVIHGGPEAQMLPAFEPVLQFFASAGFALITPNIRGSSGYGRAYLDADNVEKRLDSILDIRHLAIHIKENDKEIDGNRLVVYGGSYGGFAVLSAMTEHPDLWKCGVDIVGISNFVTFLTNTAAWRRSLREAEYGSLLHDLDTLARISPINHIDRICAPLFIIQGDNDERVPLSESIQMYETLKEKGLDVRMLRFADEGHGLAKRENRIKAYSEVLTWLRRTV
jgi:dipeptidyl aminopeptidase/acylaminoacyl peptidase